MEKDRRGNVIQPSPSSSASAAATEDLPRGEYEVFLSFRGADTRSGFTDHLYTNLVGAGVRTYRDDNDLRVGEEIGPELLRAIKGSKISIPIFSKGYASSKWCLREFAQMVECRASKKQMIFPIFYHVEPNEVQHYDRGSYKEAFLEYEKSESLDEKTVQQWKKALEIVGELKGWELTKVTNGLEGELVNIVVDEVLLNLKNYKHVLENLVGIDDHIEKMKGLLNSDSDGIRIIGILGMGGLGKTTIAKVIYNQVCEFFECHCFLKDVREKSSSSNGIINLQNQLLSKISKRQISKFYDVDEGVLKIKDAIHKKKVLVVLDDVDEQFQIDKLVGNHNWYEAGSRIIITTRNEEVLLALEQTCEKEGVREVYKSYRPELMNDNHALQLFSKHAFMRDSPSDGYDLLAKDVVSNARGLPLVLVIIGSLLFIEKDKGSWEKKLMKLKEIRPKGVIETLRISYDALDDPQKEIFLDIACFFSGVDKTSPCYMWDDYKFHSSEGIDALVRRSLITVGDDNKLWMHDELRELGRQIVDQENLKEPGKRSRLWRSHQALDTLKEDRGTKHVRLLRLCEDSDGFNKPLPRIVGKEFDKVRYLRYLQMVGIDLCGNFEKLLQDLRCFHWWRCPGNIAPTNLNLKNLLVLDLTNSRIKDRWGGWSQIEMAKQLKVLILSSCSNLCRTPHLSAFPTLERLELESCKLLSRLDGLEELELLKYLNASHCSALESLPDMSKLTNLQTLKVNYCSKLTAIQGLGKLKSLELLDTSFCDALERLPNLSNLKKLTRFKSYWCKKLVEFQGLDGSVSLEHLYISGCKSLERLPDLSNLKMLQNLDISQCTKLIKVQGLDGLVSLEHLDICRCKSLKGLPDLSNLKRLKRLHISDCETLIKIQGLDGLESLELLDVHGCKSIEYLPDFSNLTNLKELDVSYCVKLTEIYGLKELKFLMKLRTNGCKSLGNLPYLPNIVIHKDQDQDQNEDYQSNDGSQTLRLNFEALEDNEQQIFLDIACLFNGVNKLEPCYMWDACGFFPRLGISTLVSRSLITIGDDDTLIMHDSLRDLGKQIIREEGLSKLGKRSRLSGVEAWQVLETRQGTNSVQLLCLDHRDVELEGSGLSLVREDFAKLPNLRYLSMDSCLIDVDGDFEGLLSNLRWLKWRVSWEDPAPTNFYLKNLVILDLSSSYGISDDWKWWSQIKTAKKLKVLNISSCSYITTVPHLSTFMSLESLRVSSCMSLCGLDGLEQLVSLRCLDISYCDALERLPDLSNLRSLRTLLIVSCQKLIEIRGLERLESLESLKLLRCKLGNILNLSNLKKLKKLTLVWCEGLTEIRGLEELESLEVFDIYGC